jgi:hypothetical protein
MLVSRIMGTQFLSALKSSLSSCGPGTAIGLKLLAQSVLYDVGSIMKRLRDPKL